MPLAIFINPSLLLSTSFVLVSLTSRAVVTTTNLSNGEREPRQTLRVVPFMWLEKSKCLTKPVTAIERTNANATLHPPPFATNPFHLFFFFYFFKFVPRSPEGQDFGVNRSVWKRFSGKKLICPEGTDRPE